MLLLHVHVFLHILYIYISIFIIDMISFPNIYIYRITHTYILVQPIEVNEAMNRQCKGFLAEVSLNSTR